MEKPINILFFESNTSGFTGAAQSLLNLLLHIDKSKYRIRLVSPKQSMLLRYASNAGITTEVWPAKSSVSPFMRVLASWYQIPALIEYFKRENIQILHCNRLQSVLMFGWAAKLYGIPVIWHLRGRRSIGIFEIIGSLLSNRIICVSEALRQQLLQSIWIRRKDKVITLYNGIDLSRFAPGRQVPPIRAELNINNRNIVISWIGGLNLPSKHPDLFIHLAENLANSFPDCRFLIVGDGRTEPKNALKKLADDLVQKRKLIFTGFRNDVHDILPETDILVLTSSREGLPRVVLEAAASGCPVVSTEVEGINELIINKKSGYIVPQQDLESLINCVSYLIKNSDKRKRMGLAGRNYVEQNFVSESIAKKYEQIVMDCLVSNKECID